MGKPKQIELIATSEEHIPLACGAEVSGTITFSASEDAHSRRDKPAARMPTDDVKQVTVTVASQWESSRTRAPPQPQAVSTITAKASNRVQLGDHVVFWLKRLASSFELAARFSRSAVLSAVDPENR